MFPIGDVMGATRRRCVPVASLMKMAKPTSGTKRWGLLTFTLLIVILGSLFWRSFLPGYVHFSNDNPLGIQKAAWLQLPTSLTGMWGDLNDIGGNAAEFEQWLTAMIRWTLGAVGYAKFAPAIAMFILGTGAWVFFRQLRLSPLAATLGAFCD